MEKLYCYFNGTKVIHASVKFKVVVFFAVERNYGTQKLHYQIRQFRDESSDRPGSVTLTLRPNRIGDKMCLMYFKSKITEKNEPYVLLALFGVNTRKMKHPCQVRLVLHKRKSDEHIN